MSEKDYRAMLHIAMQKKDDEETARREANENFARAQEQRKNDAKRIIETVLMPEIDSLEASVAGDNVKVRTGNSYTNGAGGYGIWFQLYRKVPNEQQSHVYFVDVMDNSVTITRRMGTDPFSTRGNETLLNDELSFRPTDPLTDTVVARLIQMAITDLAHGGIPNLRR